MPAVVPSISHLIFYVAMFVVLFTAIYLCLRMFGPDGEKYGAPLSDDWKPPKSIDGSGRWR